MSQYIDKTMASVVLRSRTSGYTCFGVMFLIAIIGVLSSLILPVYQDYQVRKNVRIAMKQATVVTDVISNHYFSNAMLPDSNASAGLEENITYDSEWIKSIDISEGGTITIALNDIENIAKTQAKPVENLITLKPKSSIMGHLIWACVSTTLNESHTPMNCNEDTPTVPSIYPQTAWQLTN